MKPQTSSNITLKNIYGDRVNPDWPDDFSEFCGGDASEFRHKDISLQVKVTRKHIGHYSIGDYVFDISVRSHILGVPYKTTYFCNADHVEEADVDKTVKFLVKQMIKLQTNAQKL